MAELSEASLRAYCRAHLHRTMVPNEFVILDSFPLTSNNKLDIVRLQSQISATSNADTNQSNEKEAQQTDDESKAKKSCALNCVEREISRIFFESINALANTDDDEQHRQFSPMLKRSFAAAGGNSLNAQFLAAELHHQFPNVRVDVAALLHSDAPIREIVSELIDEITSITYEEDLNAKNKK